MWLTDLADTIRAAGLTVVEDPGWRTRGHGAMTSVQGVVCHHTAGPTAARNPADAPSLGTVRNGIPGGLSGPFAHIVLGRSGTVIVVAAGKCWHAGPVREPWMSNSHTIGIEAENSGTGEPWPEAQIAAYARLCAVAYSLT